MASTSMACATNSNIDVFEIEMDRNEHLFTLFDACRCGHLEFVKDIASDYASDIGIVNELNQNCAMLCCEFNQIEVLKYLLSHHSHHSRHLNLLISDAENGWNCLHYALRRCNFCVAQILLHKIPNLQFPKFVTDGNGYTPFDLLPANLAHKQLYDDGIVLNNKQTRRKLFHASFASMLQQGQCRRNYGKARKLGSHLTVQGVLYAWGTDTDCQLGIHEHVNIESVHSAKNKRHRSTPKIVKSLRSLSVVDVACSGYHSIAVCDDGGVFVWGNNSDGRLGLGFVSPAHKAYVFEPRRLPLAHKVKKCTATVDHSMLLTAHGAVYAFGCDKSSKIVQGYLQQVENRKSVTLRTLIWSKKLEPFCITCGPHANLRIKSVHSAFRRSVLVADDNRLYLIGLHLIEDQKLNLLTLLNSSIKADEERTIRKIGVFQALIGDAFLVLLMMNGRVLSMAKLKSSKNDRTPHAKNAKTKSIHFNEIRLQKELKFKHYHNKRDTVDIQRVTCYNLHGYARCMALANNGDIYEWKAPSTTAKFVANIVGVIDVACGPKICVCCTTVGDVFAFGDTHFTGLSGKDRKQISEQTHDMHRLHTQLPKPHKTYAVERVITLSQVGRVYATKNSVFAIQSFLWPNRNILSSNVARKTQWGSFRRPTSRFATKHFKNPAASNSRLNDDLDECYNEFEALTLLSSPDDSDSDSSDSDSESDEKNGLHSDVDSIKSEIEVKPANDGVLGLDDDDRDSNVPTLSAYCEQVLVRQIDIQTVISLYKQSFSMGFSRVFVFLALVIIENLNHLLFFLLRDCSENEVLFIEQLLKRRYFTQCHVSAERYYGDGEFLSKKMCLLERYELLSKAYPNYKAQLSKLNQTMQKIDDIEATLNADADQADQADDEVIYFDSEDNSCDNDDDETEEKSDVFDAILSDENRVLYAQKYDAILQRNGIQHKLHNSETFPSLQSMNKLRKLQKKEKQSFVRKIKSFSGLRLSAHCDDDAVLKTILFKQAEYEKEQNMEKRTGFVLHFNYDFFQKPKSKTSAKAVIYRKFDVRKAVDCDAKKAKKREQKQKQRQVASNTNNNSTTGSAAKRRRNRKKQNNATPPQTQPQQQHQKPVKNPKTPKSHARGTPNADVESTRFHMHMHDQQHGHGTSPAALDLNPIEVVRRNREKKKFERQLNNLSGDIWDLRIVNNQQQQQQNQSQKAATAATAACASNSGNALSNILATQKRRHEDEKRQKRKEKYVEFQEVNNSWTPSNSNTKSENTENETRAHEPESEVKTEAEPRQSVIELAQKEEIQFRSLVQHEYEWTDLDAHAPQLAQHRDDGGDYDAFVLEQQMLLQSFQQKQLQKTESVQNETGMYRQRDGTHREQYRGRGGGTGGQGSRGRGNQAYRGQHQERRRYQRKDNAYQDDSSHM